MIYILTISKVNPPTEKVLERMERIHEAPNREVVRKYIDDKLPNSFTISAEDDLLGNKVLHDRDLRVSMGVKHVMLVAKEKAFMKEQAKHTKDTSLTEDVKPYEPKGNTRTTEKVEIGDLG